MKSIEIEILGKKYHFKSDDPEKFLEYANYLKSQIEALDKKFNTVNQNKLYVLYSLMLTEHYFEEIEKNKALKKEIEQINSLLQKIDTEI